MYVGVLCVFFIEQKTAYDMRISDWSSDVCSSDLLALRQAARGGGRSLCSRHESLPKEWIFEDLVRSYGAWGVGVPIFCPEPMPKGRDRQSAVEGKRESVREDVGCRRTIKKQHKPTQH